MSDGTYIGVIENELRHRLNVKVAMKHLRRILLALQVVALMLYPTAAISSVSPASHGDEHSISDSHHAGPSKAESHHGNRTTRDHKHDCLPGNADNKQIAQVTRSSDFKPGPCCCVGAIGLCAILTSTIPNLPPSEPTGVEIRLSFLFAGIGPALLLHPPKVFL